MAVRSTVTNVALEHSDEFAVTPELKLSSKRCEAEPDIFGARLTDKDPRVSPAMYQGCQHNVSVRKTCIDWHKTQDGIVTQVASTDLLVLLVRR
jgi:hypothetical protein